jgi:hypothetical protein
MEITLGKPLEEAKKDALAVIQEQSKLDNATLLATLANFARAITLLSASHPTKAEQNELAALVTSFAALQADAALSVSKIAEVQAANDSKATYNAQNDAKQHFGKNI